MRNFFKKLLCLAVVCAIALTAFGCKKKVKDTRATLYVYSFTSGFGSEWLTSLIADFEEEMKDVEINGQKGIKVKPTPEQSDVSGSEFASKPYSVYFLEQQDYYDLVANNYIADMTDVITSENPFDSNGATLESKMFDDQKQYFGRTDKNGNTRYYAYPHYFTSFGIVYDVSLFDSKGYYLIDGFSNAFIGTETDLTKSAGPDGEYNTSDDGLPTTYEEFLNLCDYIANTGNDNPLVWAGQYRSSYLTHFINALATDHNGYEQMRLNYTFDGTATNLGKIIGGEFVEDATDTVIDGTNGAELARQAGKYYAMDFYSDIYNKSYVKSQNKTLYSSDYSHLKAQEDFLKRTNPENAMLLDGSWWQMEATPTFEFLGKDNTKQNMKLGWMPLPKQNSELLAQGQTMFDVMYPLCVMKNGLDTNSWEYEYTKKFIQFANSDEQLAKFTKITGCTKALDYTLTNAQYNELSYFGKSFYDAYKNAKIVFPYANNLLFANNQKTFNEIQGANGSPFYYSTEYTESTFVKALEAGKTAENYFSGMYTYFSGLNIWKKAN